MFRNGWILLLAFVTCVALSDASAQTSSRCAKLADTVGKLNGDAGQSRDKRRAYESYLRVDPRGNAEIEPTDGTGDSNDLLETEMIKQARADGARQALYECEVRESKSREHADWTVPPKKPVKIVKKKSGAGWTSF